ncbi:MAG TPA: acetolactate synthase small subunit [Hymenobacter sp.]|jgi:acetolactate synthase-1/3 small subunit
MKKDDDHTYTLTLTARNQPGVLVRCAQIFGRRGHNIEALHVAAKPGHHDVSLMTITAYGQADRMQQIMAQLEKLIDVMAVTTKETTT